MIDYGYFYFAAPPRTASTWFRKACSICGMGNDSRVGVHIPHDEGQALRLKVSMVRHPCTWLPSYYASIQGGTIEVPIVDRLTGLEYGSFDKFIDSYLEHTPGLLFEIVQAYNADTYLRVEDLPWAFIELVSSLGITFDNMKQINDLNAQNITRHLPTLMKHQRRAVMRAEKELVDRFDYY